MPVSGLIMDGLGLMLLGMGIVFSFLVILVFAMNLMSRLAGILEVPEENAPSAAVRSPVGKIEETDVVPVIAAAVATWRNRNR